MGTVWIREFTGGLDARRLPEATPGGTLISAENGHITRGGGFEKRAAFPLAYTLPAGTVGLAFDLNGIVVFGSAPAPAMPAGVRYQRLQHPDGLALVRLVSFDLNFGKIYAVGEFQDGSRAHFYDGNFVTWYDGRARAKLQVVDGRVTPAAKASGSFQIEKGDDEVIPANGGIKVISGSGGSPNVIASMTIDGVDIIGAQIPYGSSATATAQAIQDVINGYSSDPDYSAVRSGTTVGITKNGNPLKGQFLLVNTQGDFVIAPADSGYVAVPASRVTGIKINGVSIFSSQVTYATSTVATAAAVAAAINGYNSNPNYTATSSGQTVTVTAADDGPRDNGQGLQISTTGTLSISYLTAMSGGADVVRSSFSNLQIGGVTVLAGSVAWAGGSVATAAAIAAAVNAQPGSEYEAEAAGDTVTFIAKTPGSAANGKVVTWTAGDGLTLSPAQSTQMAGGTDDNLEPGTFVRTLGAKMYAISGSVLRFSGVRAPMKWQTDVVGAGFIDMASETSGAEKLTALAKYQDSIAVFGEDNIQIWYVDPDPTLNKQVQVLDNTGTSAPRSVTQFGDNDIFYLAESGLRSLRARYSSDAASVTDIGVPIDPLTSAAQLGLTQQERSEICGLIEPGDGRFWLSIKGQIYVFSYFGGAKVSAWSTYSPGFDIDTMLVAQKKVYARSGDEIFVYGGAGAAPAFDDTVAELRTPFLDVDAPARSKSWRGVDVVARGTWDVLLSMDPNRPEITDLVATIDATTFSHHRIAINGDSTHLSVTLRSRGGGAARVESLALHYEGDVDED
ncbi:hypothetical protein NPA31_011915 [Aurantimonas sp. MSK8Z-1]|uniref:hypothetical protein n=1 Tax=Mangrovibrevibacter kandeliae TaxID=2968473 RepID=UPI00211799F3|nr:hypothetical protein [Aurantimonas sp. MSK8Z-1]MCW4115670.1 hypothetical protein [Aurantimonas sp. MSK8Z-1]